jgi:N-glycosylase/DNA lyase
VDYINTENGILLKNTKDFEPEHVFECGQCFRWNRMPDGSYRGVAGGRAFCVKKVNGDILFQGINEQDFNGYWAGYFDLGRDYGTIKKALSKDPVMERAVDYGSGIRILKQDPWETLVSFIISANNRIPRIMLTIEKLCQSFGERKEQNGEAYFDFPPPRRLAALDEQDIRTCGCGFRAKYILQAARIVSEGRVDPHSLENMDTEYARSVLLCFPGIGPKVADCIMLFSMAKLDAFPVDVWVKRVMEHYYLKRETPLAQIRRFAVQKFGPLAGVAQQYLFYYARGTMGRITGRG